MLFVLLLTLPCSILAGVTYEKGCEVEGHHDPHPSDGQRYYLCLRGVWNLMRCRDGSVYDSTYGACMTPCPERGNDCQDGQQDVEPEDSLQYYECIQGLWYRKYCCAGYYYDSTTGTCLQGQIDQCGAPQYCSLGDHFSDLCNCYKFYQCDQGGAVSKDCGPGTAWNPTTATCDYADKVQLCKTLGQL